VGGRERRAVGSPARAGSNPSTQNPLIAPMDSSPLRVLLIEDDDDDSAVVRDLLRRLQRQVVSVRWETSYDRGREALESGHHDVALVDVGPGARAGLDLLRELDPKRLETPIIFLTGEDDRKLDTEAIRAGAADLLVKDELDAPLLERSILYSIHRQRLIAGIYRRSQVDELTGVLNRRGFEEHVDREIRLAVRRKRAIALLYADVDRFKQINDRYGHVEGDRALREVADILQATFRESDLIARLGGDEFAVVPIDASPESAAIPARRLRAMLDRRNDETDRAYDLSVTIGLGFLDPEAPVTTWELVASADRMMYRDKTPSV
jgi:diguanylate cyclase (GGDEF)-like protein